MLTASLAVAGSVSWVRIGVRGHVYQIDTVPAAPVAIVLGAQVNRDGSPSTFLAARLEVARQLFADGRVRAVLVSGDNSRAEYNEPDVMRDWLVAKGVPAEKVVADYAGFDTYDSCLRARRIFGVREAIVVTQTFHLARAVTLCRHVGVDAVGVGDDSVRRYRLAWRRGELREYPAAVKAAFDALTRRNPASLGPYEHSVDDAVRN